MVEWLERQLDRTDRSTSQESIKLLRRDAVLNSLKDVPAELMEEIGNTLTRESKKMVLIPFYFLWHETTENHSF